ncbi:MAG: DUF7002 family protein [Candidatus Rokuibacteriota bacterium]|jgi:hypothetical protein
MGIGLDELLRLRPFAYHTSGRVNFESIRDCATISSAQGLVRGTSQEDLLGGIRSKPCSVRVNGRDVLIRDQKPLRPGSMRLEPGTTLRDYVRELNRRVFLWPGTSRRLVAAGRGHFELYRREGRVFVIRAPLRSLLAANPKRELFLTKCNSGSARHHSGQPVQRGPGTFHRLNEATFRASKVVEFSFIERIDLPHDTEFSEFLDGPWRLLRAGSSQR